MVDARPAAPLVDAAPEIRLSVSDLNIGYRSGLRRVAAVTGVSFALWRGQTTALIGESGSGKSTIASSIVGTLPRAAHATGSIGFKGHDLLTLSERQHRPLRGREIGFVPQNPARALDPLLRVADQLDETLRVQGVHTSREDRQARALRLLERVGFRTPERVARSYPHELSGGMQQRVLIAIALTSTPQVLVADEPTSALDVTVQKAILDLIDQRRAEDQTAVLLITHDIGVAAERAQHVVVLRNGRVVEAGPTAQVLGDPQHDYTRRLLRDVPGTGPSGRPRPAASTSPPAIRLSDVSVDYRSRHSTIPHRAVDALSFEVAPGSTLAVVGESGSGKTTTARVIARFIQQSSGRTEVRSATGIALEGVSEREFRRNVQFVYQNPHSSLNPRHRIHAVLAEPLRALGIGAASARDDRVRELLDMVGLPREIAARRPHELSGGQQQRVAIARALAPDPSILVLDEPVSALDVTVQAQILRLLVDLQRRLGLTYVLISHDLAVVRQVADEIVVMHDGRLVEKGPVEQIFSAPAQPYTRRLLAAVPGLGALPLFDAAADRRQPSHVI